MKGPEQTANASSPSDAALDADAMLSMLRGKRTLLIAPHPDDVAYSMGGFVGLASPHVQLELVTVFTHSAWAAPMALRLRGVDAIYQARTAEDAAFCTRFGMRQEMLGFNDSSLRGYNDDDERGADPVDDPISADVTTALRTCIADRAPDVVFAPAAIGAHIDHRIVHEAVRSIDTRPYRVLYYEDVPYSAWYEAEAISCTLTAAGLNRLAVVAIDNTIETKIATMRDYASQTEEDTIEDMLAHARRTAFLTSSAARARASYAEAFWK